MDEKHNRIEKQRVREMCEIERHENEISKIKPNYSKNKIGARMYRELQQE